MTTVNGIGPNQTIAQTTTKKSNTKQVVKGIVIGAAAAATVAVAIKNRKPIGEAVKKAVTTIKETFTKPKIQTVIKDMKNKAKDAFEKIKTTGTETLNAFSGAKIGEGFKNAWNATTKFAKNIWTNAGKYASKAWDVTKTFVTKIVQKVVEFVKGFGKSTGTGAV